MELMPPDSTSPTTRYGTLPSYAPQRKRKSPMSGFQRVETSDTASSEEQARQDDVARFSQGLDERGLAGDVLQTTNSSFINARNPSSPNQIWQAIQDRRNCLVEESVSSGSTTTNSKWVALAFGQLIAILATSMNASSFTLTSHYGVDTQFFQMFLMYLLLCIHLHWRRTDATPLPRDDNEEEAHEQEEIDGEVHETNDQSDRGNDDNPSATTAPTIRQHERHHILPFTRMRLKVPWYFYLLFSVLDVFPNFLALLSFHYTSLTSTTLLGSLTVPATMIFSKYILAKTFGFYHYIGVLLCVLGGTLTIWADADSSNLDGGGGTKSHSYIGDLLAVTAALFYGLGDASAEFFAKHVDRFEYVGMLGVFGTIITGATFPLLELDAIRGITRMPAQEKAQVCTIMVWYIFSVFLYYTTEAKFLVSSDATLLNLSMQASNLWAILFAVIAYHSWPSTTFYFALCLVICGVFIYELLGGSTSKGPSDRMINNGTSTDTGCNATAENRGQHIGRIEIESSSTRDIV